VSVKRAVVDTNVVVSALVGGGTPQKIIQAWITGQFLAVMSEELKYEINTVLNRSKLAPFDKKRRVLLGTLLNQALMVLPRKINQIAFEDKDDHFLLELAVTGQAFAIVTGDKGLLKLKKVSGVEILNPDYSVKN
jgi:putative PIN family toxin of toxin-antitoxin system